MIAALVMAGALATFHSTRTQAVSGTTLGTLISGNGSTVDLLILWRGSPGWLGKGGGGGSGGGSGSSMSGSIEYGDVAQTFSDSRVVAYQIGPDTTTVVDGDTGTQRGTYHQRVASPDGHVTDASGSFTISWVFVDGRWRIKRMETHSNQ